MCNRIIFVLFVMASISDDVQFSVSGQQFSNIQEEAMQNEANKHDNLHGTFDVNANTTTILARNSSNEAQPDADTSASRLLNVTVPSSVRARPGAWKEDQIPEEDDLDNFMKNTTGCEYMADRSHHQVGRWQSVSNSTARGTWRRPLAVRGQGWAYIRVTWSAEHDYRLYIGSYANMETVVWDFTRSRALVQRDTPGVMAKQRYTNFYYIQLEDGVMSIGALGDVTPWLRHNVSVSAGDVIQMGYYTGSPYGVKLLVCA